VHCPRGKRDHLPVPTGALEAFATTYDPRMQGVKIPCRQFTARRWQSLAPAPPGLPAPNSWSAGVTGVNHI